MGSEGLMLLLLYTNNAGSDDSVAFTADSVCSNNPSKSSSDGLVFEKQDFCSQSIV